MRLLLITDLGEIELDEFMWSRLNWANPRLLWVSR
jgi:hypothetical protein